MLRRLDMADLVGLAGLALATGCAALLSLPLAGLVLGTVLMVVAWNRA